MLVGRRTAHNRASFEPRKGQMINGKYSFYRKCMHAWLQVKLVVASLVILILCKRQAETPCAQGIQERAEKKKWGSFCPSLCNLQLSTPAETQILSSVTSFLEEVLNSWAAGLADCPPALSAPRGAELRAVLAVHCSVPSCSSPEMFLSAVALGSAWMKFSDKRNFCQKCWFCCFSLRGLETSCLDLKPHCSVSLLVAFFGSPPELASHQLVHPAHWHPWKQIYLFIYFVSERWTFTCITELTLKSRSWDLMSWCRGHDCTAQHQQEKPRSFQTAGNLGRPHTDTLPTHNF